MKLLVGERLGLDPNLIVFGTVEDSKTLAEKGVKDFDWLQFHLKKAFFFFFLFWFVCISSFALFCFFVLKNNV